MYVIGKKPFKVKEENKETYHETTRLYNILARILAPNPQQIRHSPTHSQQNDFKKGLGKYSFNWINLFSDPSI